jgi:uncharacterized protein YecT (DUF1311 family)
MLLTRIGLIGLKVRAFVLRFAHALGEGRTMQYSVRLAAGLCGVFGCLLLGVGSVQAKRVALIVGNADYKVGPLQNPVNDATAIADALRNKLRFDNVILKRNVGAEAFRVALGEFRQQAMGADLAVIYFAGHGIEIGGRNFLIPVDATLAQVGDVELQAIALDTVLKQLGGVRKLRLVILDACRNNPFAIAGAKRNLIRGLSRVEPEDNTLIAYAAKDGTTADDGPGRLHSPFTEALLTHIGTPGVDVRFLFAHVRNEVMKMTHREQQPHLYGTLGPDQLFLLPPIPTVEDAKPGVGTGPSSETASAKARAEAAKLRAEAEIAQAEAARLKSRTEMERAKAEAERVAAELAKARAETELARAQAAAARAETERARERAEKERQAFVPSPVTDTTSLFSPAAVPSFSCRDYAATPLSSPNKNPQTDMLCIDPQAARADLEMGKVYEDSIRGLTGSARRAAVARQREWIRERDRRCPASWSDLSLPERRRQIAQCLIRETSARMRELRR